MNYKVDANNRWLSSRKKLFAFTWLAFYYSLINCSFISQTHAECLVIDTDYDIDDLMAIPALVGNMHVAGIVTTEGYTHPAAAAATLSKLLADPNQRKIPVIVGVKTNISDQVVKQKWPWLPYVRDQMHQSNGLFPTQIIPAETDSKLIENVISSVSACNKVSVILLGPFSSFIEYSPYIMHKIDKVIVSGKPFIDINQKKPFNCNYDLAACIQAAEQLKDINSVFIDIPRHNINYEPDEMMVDGLVPTGLPGVLKQALTNNYATWLPQAVSKENGGPGGKSLLWDQITALYVLHPDLFAAPTPEAKHLEPILINNDHAQTLDFLRKLWTKDSNQAIEYK